jgi:hypothetical protein
MMTRAEEEKGGRWAGMSNKLASMRLLIECIAAVVVHFASNHVATCLYLLIIHQAARL